MLEGAYIGGRPKSTRCSDVARRFAEVGGALFEQRLRLGVRVFERRPRYVYMPDEWREKALSVAPQASRRISCSKRATPLPSKYTCLTLTRSNTLRLPRTMTATSVAAAKAP